MLMSSTISYSFIVYNCNVLCYCYCSDNVVYLLGDLLAANEIIMLFSAWIGSLQIALTFMLSPIASILVDCWGIRASAMVGSAIACLGMLSSSFVNTLELYYLTYGLFLGAGSSLVYTPSMVILGHYFKRRLGLVNGIVSFGSAVFTIVLPPVISYSLDRLELRWTMRMLSILYALLFLCALTWKPQFTAAPQQQDDKSKKESVLMTNFHKICNVDIWKNKGYRVWAIALPVAFLGYFIPFVHLVSNDPTNFRYVT